MRKGAMAITAVVLAVTSVACSKSSSSPPAGGSSGGGGSCTAASATALSGPVTIKDFAFNPNCFSVSGGSTISLNNQDPRTHTFTVDGTSVNVSVNAGTSASATAPAAGTYSFHCTIHPSMTGTLVVT